MGWRRLLDTFLIVPAAVAVVASSGNNKPPPFSLFDPFKVVVTKFCVLDLLFVLFSSVNKQKSSTFSDDGGSVIDDVGGGRGGGGGGDGGDGGDDDNDVICGWDVTNMLTRLLLAPPLFTLAAETNEDWDE